MRKLMSRKFILTLTTLICLMIIYLTSNRTQEIITAVISAVVTVVSYVVSESSIDRKNKGGD